MMQAPAPKLPDAIVTLCDEHRYVNLLLDTLGEQLQEVNRADTGRFYLMQDIVTYLHKYSDVVHHPTEDLLFDKLIKRDPSSAMEVRRLQRDHEKLTQNTAAILELLGIASKQNSADANEAAYLAIDAYSSALRKHMQREESELFAKAVRCLSHADWRQIETRLESMQDPLFGSKVGSEYRVLYEFLSSRSDRVALQLSRYSFLQLENFIVSVDAFEQGVGDMWRMLHRHAGSIAERSRATVDQTLRGGSLKSVLSAQFGLATFLGKAAFSVGIEAMSLNARTLKNMALPFFSPNNRS